MAKIDISDIDIYATKKRIQWLSGFAPMDYVLESGYAIDEYFEYNDDWEEEDTDDEEFNYEINVNGVISQSDHNNAVERLTEKIDKLQKQVEELLKKDLNLKKHDKVEEE